MKAYNDGVRLYNMAILSENAAEINMYGEVVQEVPTDWDGTRLHGYIGADELLEDIEKIKDKQEITIHINSGGGDLFAGLAIYNRLKELKGNVTTINDGIAASAASLIFQAGNKRIMNAGSTLMAHGAGVFMIGYYTVDEIENARSTAEAANKAIVNVYAEAMGVDASEAEKYIENETWLTGQEAVDAGLADSMAEERPKESSLMNKLLFKLSNTAKAPIFETKNIIEEEREEEMEIKNLEELRNAFPDFVREIEDKAHAEAKANAINAERARLKGIEEIENRIADKDLVIAAKYGEKPMTAEQLALEAMKQSQIENAAALEAMDSGIKESGTVEVAAAAEEVVDEKEEINTIVNLFNKMNGGRK